jgi:hypothetical protein
MVWFGLVLWCLAPLSTIFQLKWRDLSQVNDKLYQKMLYISPWLKFELTTSLVMGTD